MEPQPEERCVHQYLRWKRVRKHLDVHDEPEKGTCGQANAPPKIAGGQNRQSPSRVRNEAGDPPRDPESSEELQGTSRQAQGDAH